MLDVMDTNVRHCSTFDEYHARDVARSFSYRLLDQFTTVPSIAVARPHAPGSIFSTQGGAEHIQRAKGAQARQSPGPSALSSAPFLLALCVSCRVRAFCVDPPPHASVEMPSTFTNVSNRQMVRSMRTNEEVDDRIPWATDFSPVDHPWIRV
jgi:hypothetical protein